MGIVGCKFTPLGFETAKIRSRADLGFCVNLPRWGLKLYELAQIKSAVARCKFTPLGFETLSTEAKAIKGF